MSKVWICREKTAEVPFWVEEQKINLYSLEELCYYLYQNVEVLEEDFFEERLLAWLERELKLTGLCERLREGMSQGKNGFWCMEMLLWESGYYTRTELEELEKTISLMVQAKPEERGKMRADKLLLDGKYKGAVREYQHLLQQGLSDRSVESKVWHNMGTAYAGQFLFRRAAECYEKAYTMGRREESRMQYLTACAFAEGELPENTEMAKKNQELQQLKEQAGIVAYEEEIYQRLEHLAQEYMRNE